MACLTYILEDLDYYCTAHQTFLRYAKKCGPVGNWSEEAFKEEVVQRLSDMITPKEPLRVLSIGSGAGDVDCKMLSKLLPYFPEIHNTILEPSKSQLKLFKERVKEHEGDLPHVTFTWRNDTIDNFVEELDSDDMGGSDEGFHLIHLVHSIYYTDDLSRTLRVLYHALKEGGTLFIAVLPDDCIWYKLADIQIKHGAFRPIPLTHGDVLTSLKQLRLPYTIKRGTWHVPSSQCFDENSKDGRHLLDFFTHTKNFRGTASRDVLEEVLTYLESSSTTQADGETMTFREWVHITVVKEENHKYIDDSNKSNDYNDNDNSM
ncbi:histamine N-methyltransferase A-like isoform X2 [Lytechinus variegatus]|uniref:histamine N-methyltransferase A-like isoform X2 n=1 Tax=Lytechinus variegatus TaxID=7654 RepID=UPI001BB22383|nr:histamine N-methyltransferase A-like isoform X2 [Lytechinus variegatus]